LWAFQEEIQMRPRAHFFYSCNGVWFFSSKPNFLILAKLWAQSPVTPS
jgi:hypothetical protein